MRTGCTTGKRPVHYDGGVCTLDLDADVASGKGRRWLCGRTQGDRHKGLWPIDQCALSMFAQPVVHDVGVDAVLLCHCGNGRARLGAGADNLQLEFSAVEPPLGSLGGASIARHGVHDIHRAHYLWTSESLQCVFAGRIPMNLQAVRKTFVLTVEGERDDICGMGQTLAAQDLCSMLPAYRKTHHLQSGVGHNGVFNGRRWES